MSMIKVLLTCPPMIKNIHNYMHIFKEYNIVCDYPQVVQTLSEDELVKMVPKYDAWIAGDDPATHKVLNAGKQGNLKALIKWGVGIDNVDQQACKDFGIYFSHTPGMFGEEVSDVVIGYLIMLNRKLHEIDKKVKEGEWYKPRGVSLYGKKVCIVGFGDIGQTLVRKLQGFNMKIYVSDPAYIKLPSGQIYNKQIETMLNSEYEITISDLDTCMDDAEYVIVTCNLNKNTYHLINENNLIRCKRGVKIINVARGSIINENDVISLFNNGHIDSVAFDVFEKEPLEKNNQLRKYPNNIFGSHNCSNTNEGVDRTSKLVIEKIAEFFNKKNKQSKL